MPLYNWIECLDNRYNFSRIKPSAKDLITQKDVEAWELIYETYIEKFGLNELYARLLALQKKRAVAQCDYIVTKNSYNFNIIRKMDVEIIQIKKEMNKGVTTEKVLVHLSKYMGYRQDVKKITVLEYFTLIKEYEREH